MPLPWVVVFFFLCLCLLTLLLHLNFTFISKPSFSGLSILPKGGILPW